MVLRFCVVLLAVSILTEGFNVEDDNIPSDENYFAPEFRWTRLSYNSFMLICNTQQLLHHRADTIDVLVKPKYHHGHKVHKNISVTEGEVIIDGLEPNTLYAVIVKAFAHGSAVLRYQTLFQAWPTAPSHVPPPKGKAISPTQIMLRWVKPTHPNGILKPYRLICFNAAADDEPIVVTTKTNKTTKIQIADLTPSTTYECLVVASTIPADGQNPAECERPSDLSSPIRTPPTTEAMQNGVTTSGSDPY